MRILCSTQGRQGMADYKRQMLKGVRSESGKFHRQVHLVSNAKTGIAEKRMSDGTTTDANSEAARVLAA